jgi:flagellar protein FliO/FliZ
MEWMLVKTLLSLFAVIGLMVGIIIVMKKYGYMKGRAPGSSMVAIDILGHRSLAPKRSVHVLKVLNKVMVVGVTEGGMNTLGEITDVESLRQIDELVDQRSGSANNFANYVDKYLRSLSRNGSKGNGKSVNGLSD